MSHWKDQIFYRLLLSYAITIAIGAVVLLLSVLFLTPRAYQRHMQNGDQTGGMLGGGTMNQTSTQGGGQLGMQNGTAGQTTQTLGNFRAGILEALVWSLLASGLTAFAISIYFSKQILAPLKQFNLISHSIADGNYASRVKISGTNEFARLADSFNTMTAKLQQVEDTRVRMIGDVSHELRTPLTIIGGYMEGLSDGVIPAEKDTFDLISRETARLTRLVNGLQELSKVEAGSVQLKSEPVSLSKLTQNLIHQYQPLFDEKKVQLTLELDPNQTGTKLIVLGVEDRLTQVLTNLLANALQYSPEDKKVRIGCRTDGKQVHITVKDEGIGLSSENQSKVFERFYRVDRSRNRDFGNGSGIGLSIAKALVEQHNGSIWAESAGEGSGTTFHILLPLM